MKIAYIADVIYPFTKGGSEKRIFEVSKILAQRGHEPHVFGIKWWAGESTFERDGVVYHGISRPPSSLFTKSRRSIKEALYFSSHVPHILLKEHFDIVHCLQSPLLHMYFAKGLSHIRKYALVLEWYEVWADYWSDYIGILGMIGKIVEQNLIKVTRDDKIITISEYTKKRLVSLGAVESNIAVIPNGIDYSLIQKVSPSKDNLDVIFVGRLIKAKNADILIRTIPLLKEYYPEIKVGIVGDGPERASIEQLAKTLCVGKNVTFYGRIHDFPEMISLVKGSKSFVYPAAPEGGGSLSMFEANACGVPTIAIKSGPLGTSAEVIRDGFNGLLVEEASPKSIANKIIELLSNEQLKYVMGVNAKGFSKQFDWAEIVNQVEKFYFALD